MMEIYEKEVFKIIKSKEYRYLIYNCLKGEKCVQINGLKKTLN